MMRGALFPGRYEQGAGALALLGETAARLGRQALVVCDAYTREHVLPRVTAGLTLGLPWADAPFAGECSDEAVAQLADCARTQRADVVIGIGGGKAQDTAKAVADAITARSLIVPTLAASDAPCSGLAVIHHPDGRFKRYQVLRHSPDAVLVDTALIAQAPPRMLAAGMGDAFATWFEAEDSHKAGRPNLLGRSRSRAAQALARLCYDTLLEFGLDALRCVAQQRVEPALDEVVEANLLLSGIGFESGGLAAAHAIQNGLSTLPETRGALHGEKVAFGLQAMLLLAQATPATLDAVYEFCGAAGLPTTLAQIGLEEPDAAQLHRIAATACAPGESPYSPHTDAPIDDVTAAIKAADAEGRWRRREA